MLLLKMLDMRRLQLNSSRCRGYALREFHKKQRLNERVFSLTMHVLRDELQRGRRAPRKQSLLMRGKISMTT